MHDDYCTHCGRGALPEYDVPDSCIGRSFLEKGKCFWTEEVLGKNTNYEPIEDCCEYDDGSN